MNCVRYSGENKRKRTKKTVAVFHKNSFPTSFCFRDLVSLCALPCVVVQIFSSSAWLFFRMGNKSKLV